MAADLSGTLDIDDQHEVSAVAELPLGVVGTGPIQVPEHLRPLQELAPIHHALEAIPANKIIVHTVSFARPYRPRGIRPRHHEIGHHPSQTLYERRLAGA